MAKKPYVVGITGGTASGKTTMVERLPALLEPLRVYRFNCDYYYRYGQRLTVVAPFTGIEYKEANVPEALGLKELFRDFADVCEGNTEEEYEVVLIEGLFTLYLPEIRNRLSLKIFIDLQSDERLIRRIRRWIPQGQTFDEIADRYLDTVRYRHQEYVEPTRWYADLVINGTLSDKSMDIVATYIKADVARKKEEEQKPAE